ncbi:MAG: OmpA family protein [Nitrosomonas sp.]|nr:OmpA family protein [Nitrosomonas sp.]
MSNFKVSFLTLLLTSFLISCASNPPNQTLIDAENRYKSAQMIEGIQNSDAQSMGEAKEALNKAKKLQTDNESPALVEHFAFVSIKKTEIAEERHRLRQIEQETEQAKDKRQQLMLENKANELRNAKLEALKLASQLESLKAEQTERGIIMTLENILFEFSSARLQPGGETTVTRIADYLNNYPNRYILIEGFTDSVGSEAYNQKLSRQRAESVQHSLIRHGVNPRRISVAGLGEAYPVAPNTTETGRQQNRRVEIVIANEDGKPILNR